MLATVFAMTAFLVQLAAPAAQAAAAPPDNVGSIFPAAAGPFFNDFTSTFTENMNLVSDRGGPAQLRAISTHAGTTQDGATQMTWFDCDTGKGPGADGSQVALLGALDPSCIQDGQATKPVIAARTTASGLASTDVDDAWSVAFDVPARLNGQERDLVAVGCNGAALTPPTNCTGATVDTWFDDSSTSTPNATSSGTITAIDQGFSDTAGATSGLAVSDSDGFLATGSTSPELTQVVFAYDDGSGGAVTAATPAGCVGGDVDCYDFRAVTLPDTTTATAKTWSTDWFSGPPDVAFSPNNGTAFTFSSGDNGSFFVNASLAGFAACHTGTEGCAMDRVYLVSEDGSAFADHTFLRQAKDVVLNPDCKTGVTTISAAAGSIVDLTGCVINAFKVGVADDGVKWTVNDLANASFAGTPDATTDASGYANAGVTGPTSAVGKNVTITFCPDEDNNGICDFKTTAGDMSSAFQITWTGATAGTHKRSVTLKLKGSLTAKGKVKALDGFAACVSKVPVKVQKKSGGNWKTIKSIKTSKFGSYSTKIPDKSGKYRSLAPKVTKAGAICSKAHSPTRSA